LNSIAAIDFGRKWIGIAVAAEDGSGAYPVSTIGRRSLAFDLEQIRKLLAEYQVIKVVVGLPLSMDGTMGPLAVAAQAFAHQLGEVSGLEIDLFDERLTSFEAQERLKGLSTRKKRQAIDAVAACVILEGWLQNRGRAVE
jgi:putative holliday junction resolvase